MQAPVLVMSMRARPSFPQAGWMVMMAIHRQTTFADFSFADTNSGDRQVGRKAQMSNIAAAKTYVLP